VLAGPVSRFISGGKSFGFGDMYPEGSAATLETAKDESRKIMTVRNASRIMVLVFSLVEIIFYTPSKTWSKSIAATFWHVKWFQSVPCQRSESHFMASPLREDWEIFCASAVPVSPHSRKCSRQFLHQT
jgi:hypothetical protein